MRRFQTFLKHYGVVSEDYGVLETITGFSILGLRVYYGVFELEIEHYGEKTSITEYLKGLRGFYEYTPVILEDFRESSLQHDFQLRTISYIPVGTRCPLSLRERGRFVLSAHLRSRQMKF